MTTYTLTLTPPDGPKTVTRNLSREDALWALHDLVYGADLGDLTERLDDRRQAEEPIAA